MKFFELSEYDCEFFLFFFLECMAVNAGEKGEKTKIWGLDASCGSSYFGMCCHV